MTDENQKGVDALEKLRDDLRYPMADVRQILENFTVGNWKCALVVGDPESPKHSLIMIDEGLEPDGLIALIEGALGGGDGGK